ncbi:MAG: SCO family protein [Gammaproteobacteria bacterium]|nr:SCO family protein [Gammaproteobacteria bacterium]
MLKISMMAIVLIYSGSHITVSAAAQLEVDTNANGPFALVDHRGKPITDDDFRGNFMLVFFGYTFCPDVCPMDLQIIAQTLDELGKAGDQVQPIFITVDPARDTPEVMAEYANHFHPRLIGLTGTRQQTAEAARKYGVISMKIIDQDNPESYSINHSALTYLLGPDGKFVAAFDHGTDLETLISGILQHLTKPVE